MGKIKPSRSQLQLERFIETARALESDENQERFEAKLGKLAKVKPAPLRDGKSKPDKKKVSEKP